jgi:SAM-dependent methyltransferase
MVSGPYQGAVRMSISPRVPSWSRETTFHFPMERLPMPASDSIALQRATMPPGTQTILNSRTLATAHQRLAAMLQPGTTVLDIGCGTGAITAGIAAAVAPHGRALGMDVHAGLVQEAAHTHGHIPGLYFALGDVYHVPCRAAFDIVSAARVLQWLAHPQAALQQMLLATKPGGTIVLLDYNHEKIRWHPSPPHSMQVFYNAFLRWRAEAGMDNALADHLAALCSAVGLTNVVITPQHEVTERQAADFATRVGLWADVAASRGRQMVQAGVITESQRLAAEQEYRLWLRDTAMSQTLYLLAVEGVRGAT